MTTSAGQAPSPDLCTGVEDVNASTTNILLQSHTGSRLQALQLPQCIFTFDSFHHSQSTDVQETVDDEQVGWIIDLTSDRSFL